MRLMRPTSVPRRTRCVRAGAAALSGALTLAAGAASNQVGSANRDSAIATASKEQGRMLMTVGARRFTVTPEDNRTARAFVQLLPITLDMAELNGNEKHAKLPRSLPTDPAVRTDRQHRIGARPGCVAVQVGVRAKDAARKQSSTTVR